MNRKNPNVPRGAICDYAVRMRDSTGRTIDLYINADSVFEMTETGLSLEEAAEELESNAFANAIAAGKIGADAWKI